MPGALLSKVDVKFTQIGGHCITPHPYFYSSFDWFGRQILFIAQVSSICNHCFIYGVMLVRMVKFFEVLAGVVQD